MKSSLFLSRRPTRAAFTLIEVMVALAIFSVLLVIIFIPLTQGVRFTQIGTTRADMQQVAQTTMNRITREIRTAAVVFPNERMAGVTTNNGYGNNVANTATEKIGYPYYQGTANVCTTVGRAGAAALPPVENTSRLDFIPAARGANGGKADYITTLYAARSNPDPAVNYDDFDNPLVLYRATLPYTQSGTNYGILVNNSRYPNNPDNACSTNAAAINLGTQWLKQTIEGEVGPTTGPNGARVGLQGLVEYAPDYNNANAASSITRVTPLGSALYAPRANAAPVAPATTVPDRLIPETTFICEDTNGNGIIDRVTVTLVLSKFDNNGSQNRAQTVRLTQAVDLPNTESRFGVPIP